MLDGSEEVSIVQAPAKSASTKQSIVLLLGCNIYPFDVIPFKYLTIHLTANLCALVGAVLNREHWCTANRMSGLDEAAI
jgi:hypothetical protein